MIKEMVRAILKLLFNIDADAPSASGMKEKAEHTLRVYTDKELRPFECDEKEVSVEGDIHLFSRSFSGACLCGSDRYAEPVCH